MIAVLGLWIFSLHSFDFNPFGRCYARFLYFSNEKWASRLDRKWNGENENCEIGDATQPWTHRHQMDSILFRLVVGECSLLCELRAILFVFLFCSTRASRAYELNAVNTSTAFKAYNSIWNGAYQLNWITFSISPTLSLGRRLFSFFFFSLSSRFVWRSSDRLYFSECGAWIRFHHFFHFILSWKRETRTHTKNS